MRKQKRRKILLLLSMLLFPITLNYFSPYLIIQGSFEGVLSGSAIIFVSMFIVSLVLGRAFCGWVCPAGAIQECCMQINERPVGRKQNIVKYILWVPWLVTIIAGFIAAGGVRKANLFYYTDHGISVSNIYGFIIYFGVVGLVLLLALVVGKCSFCHSVCWMAPFMILGSKIKNKCNYPSLHLEGNDRLCIQCGKCNAACPMSLKVSEMVKENEMSNDECILCGSCSSVCPRQAVEMKFGKRKNSK